MKNLIIKSRIIPLDLCAMQSQINQSKKRLFCANGFVYKRFDRFFLVTALSVLTGRDIYTGNTKHLNCYVPDTLVFNSVDKLGTKKQLHSVPLYVDNMPVWMVHPTKQRTIDIAVIPLDEKLTDIEALNDFEADLMELTDDIFVYGYPLSFQKREDKDESFVHKIKIIFEDEDRYVVDGVTRQGFYGGSVFVNQKNSFVPAFLGVYSGFDKNNTSLESQISVWKKELIDEIIDSKFFDESYM